MRKYLSTIALVLLSVFATAREHFTYDMFLFGNKIGRMTVSRDLKSDGSEFYILETRANAKFLWIKRENYTRYQVSYNAGQLISSVTKEMENGELKRWTKVIRDGNRYLVDSYKGKSIFTEVPEYSVVTIFFKNIYQVKNIFYEGEAEFCKLKKSEEADTWEFKSNDGNRNVYHFQEGAVQTMEFHVSFATIKLIRVR